MADKMAKVTEPNKKKNQEEFVWIHDEIQLMLEAILVYKSSCKYEGITWESVKTKYQKITDIY